MSSGWGSIEEYFYLSSNESKDEPSGNRKIGFAFVSQVSEKMLVKKFEITQNRSLDAMDDIVNRRKMTEFGNIALVEEREDDHDVALRLPGVRRGDMASRSFKPEVRVSQLQFSPTARSLLKRICLQCPVCFS